MKDVTSIFVQIFWPPPPLSHASSVAFYVECERIFVVMVMQGARAVAQMSWKYPRRPPNSHEYPPWRMMRVWAVKYVHLRSSENPKTQHIQHTSQNCKYCVSASAPTKSSQTLKVHSNGLPKSHAYCIQIGHMKMSVPACWTCQTCCLSKFYIYKVLCRPMGGGPRIFGPGCISGGII